MTENTATYRDEELGDALRALETPEHGPGFDAELGRRLAGERPGATDARRPGHGRLSRRRIGSILLAAAVAVPAVVLGVQAVGSDAPTDWSAAVGDLPALAPGEPRPQAASTTSLIVQVSREDLVSEATRVFVGTVVAEGGSEFVDPEYEDPNLIRMTVHRVRFDVERTLRGEDASALDLTIADSSLEADVFEVGDRLLVFANPNRFGELAVPGLAPMGDFQGAFRVGDDGTARNEGSGVTFDVDELESELQTP